MSRNRKIDKKVRCFIADQELKATQEAIEITHAKPAKDLQIKVKA